MIGSNAAHVASGPGSPYGGGMPGGWGQGGPGHVGPPGGGGFGPPGGGGFGPPGGGGGGMAPVPAGPRTDALAIVSLVAGIVGLLLASANIVTMIFGACCVVCTIGSTFIGGLAALLAGAGLVSGVLSVRRIAEKPEELTGKGVAIAGAVVAGIGLLVAIATIVLPWLGLGCMAASSAAGGGGPYGGGSHGGGSHGGGSYGGGAYGDAGIGGP